MSSKQKTPDFQEKKDVEPAEGEPKKDAGETRSVAAEEQKVSQPGESEKRDVVEKLTAQLEEANKKAQENWDRAVRLQAEMDNLRRRTLKDVENAHKFALEGFSKELLTVIDSLELGIQAALANNADVEKLREGSELTLKQLESVFAKFKIEAIDPVGQPFNPEYHQAMSMHPTRDSEPNTVITCFQKGYTLNGRLIRPAMVVVAKKPDEAPKDTPKIDEQA